MRFRSILVALAALSGLVATGDAAAAPVSNTFNIVGYEYAFTSTLGCFAGTASGNAGDRGFWNACVQHDPLGSTPTPYIDGGRLALTTLSASTFPDAVTGSFVPHGGTIKTIASGTNCTNQEYLVSGALRNAATTTTTGGTGTFSVVLTHYRASVFGHCAIYKAKVSGTVTFAY